MYILGIWDGHDCGAAIVEGNEIKVAVNEERFTRRKLEVGFPENSVKCCLDFLGLKPTDISDIAITTTDFAKTLTRVLPKLKENYYLFKPLGLTALEIDTKGWVHISVEWTNQEDLLLINPT